MDSSELRGSWPKMIKRASYTSYSFFGRMVFEEWVRRNKITAKTKQDARDVFLRFKSLCDKKPEKRGTYITSHNPRTMKAWLVDTHHYTLNGDMVDNPTYKPDHSAFPLTKPYPPRKKATTVYVISNPSMPGLVKIGKTALTARERADQLQVTSIPTPFNVEAELNNCDADRIERELHKKFAHIRISENREYFQVCGSDLEQIICEMSKYAAEH